MTKPGMSRRTSAGRPGGSNSTSSRGITTSDEDAVGNGAVTVTGGRRTGGPVGASLGVCAAAVETSSALMTRRLVTRRARDMRGSII